MDEWIPKPVRTHKITSIAELIVEAFSNQEGITQQQNEIKVPSLCVARINPSSCVLSGKIYLIGGDDFGKNRSMECLNAEADMRGDPDTYWYRIDVAEADSQVMLSSQFIAPFNETEFVCFSVNNEFTVADIWIFD